MARVDQRKRGPRRRASIGALDNYRALAAADSPRWADRRAASDGTFPAPELALRHLFKSTPPGYGAHNPDPADDSDTLGQMLRGLTLGDLRAVWSVVGEPLLARWAAEHPGTRPWAWWAWDAPELRGERDGWIAWSDGAEGDPGLPDGLDPRRAETTAEYLSRLDLLLPGEAAALATLDQMEAAGNGPS
jgi:hypothetical protein